MKKFQYAILLIICIMLMSGCARKTDDPALKAMCSPSHIEQTPCGACVVNECKKLCDACTFNSPVCQACWQCIADRSCGVDSSSDNFSRYKSTDNKHHFYGKHIEKIVPATNKDMEMR